MAEQKSLGVYPPYFNNYMSFVENYDLEEILSTQPGNAEAFFNSLPEDRWLYKYAENKWTVKEVLQHIIDTERVFTYRALAFSRKDPNTLPSFNENEYAKNSNGNSRSPKDLIEEFLAVRKSSELLFKSLSDTELNAVGKTSNYEMSVKAIGYMIAGHFAHHVNILKERYLATADD